MNIEILLPAIVTGISILISICFWMRDLARKKSLEDYKAKLDIENKRNELSLIATFNKKTEIWEMINELKELTATFDFAIDLYPFQYENYENFDPEPFSFESFEEILTEKFRLSIEKIIKNISISEAYIDENLFQFVNAYLQFTSQILTHITLQMATMKVKIMIREWYKMPPSQMIIESDIFTDEERKNFQTTWDNVDSAKSIFSSSTFKQDFPHYKLLELRKQSLYKINPIKCSIERKILNALKIQDRKEP